VDHYLGNIQYSTSAVDPPYSLNPDPAFKQIQIQGFNDKNRKKKLKFFYIFLSKISITYPWAVIKDVQAKGEAFSPQKRTSSKSNKEIYYLFSIFVSHFCPPGSGTPLNPDPVRI
jgi:hypothetical protein